MTLTRLRCLYCGKVHDHTVAQNTCRRCGGPLSAEYDLETAKEKLTRRALERRAKTLWRFAEVLPIVNSRNVVSLGEGCTPILRLARAPHLLLKDDGQLPTGTFKARGLCVAVSKARELGIGSLAIPSAGNAGAALACYAARAGIKATVYMPRDAPESAKAECVAYGAKLVLVDGNISDASVVMRASAAPSGPFDVSTFKEPYRLEGKKTMGYEIAESLDFEPPDAILYPTGGGTGLIGMWKAFEEMEEMGLLKGPRPRMISVQASGCAPVVQAFLKGEKEAGDFPNPSTIAAGLRVPSPFAGRQILRVLSESKGAAVATSDSEILSALRNLASEEGILACPEGAATYAAYLKLTSEGRLSRSDRVLLYNTGSGLKYLDLVQRYPG